MTKPETILFLSDGHFGSRNSDITAYQDNLRETMGRYTHVVLNGDMFELMFLPGLARGLAPKERRAVLKTAIRQAVEWLDATLQEYPQTQFHFVLGNHENIRKFRHKLDALQEKHAHFEWDPEAIRIGDAVAIHGDLLTRQQSDRTRPIYRARDVDSQHGWVEKIVKIGDKPLQMLSNFWNCPQVLAEMIVPPQLDKWDEITRQNLRHKMSYRHEGERKPFSLDGVKHIFLGHTHYPFDNHRYDGLTYHNSGSFIRALSKPEQLRPLEATMQDGKVLEVKAVRLEPDREKSYAAQWEDRDISRELSVA